MPEDAIQLGSEKVPQLISELATSRSSHNKLVREHKATEAIARDQVAFQILSDDPSSLFKKIRSAKRGKGTSINKLTVGDKVYSNDSVADGFFDSISSLKTRDSASLASSKVFNEFSNDYKNILQISANGAAIPKISEKDAFDLLMKLKPDV